jgi:lysophospholipase L1-like esterase
MPLGDSITRGSNSANAPNGDIPGGYRKELASRLTASGTAFDFVGARSDNASGGLDPHHGGIESLRTSDALASISAWLALKPDIVLLHLGTNDILQNVPVATASNRLDLLIGRITSDAPERRLYLATLIPITQDWNGRSAAVLNAAVTEFNVQVRNLVQKHAALGRKVILVDMNASINLAANFYQPGDGIRPGQAGYDQMGTIWYNAISVVRHLTVESSVPSAAAVTVSPADRQELSSGTTPFARIYQDATQVTVTAPNAVGNYRFQKWLKNGVPFASELTTRVTMDGNHTLTAMYAQVSPAFPANLQIMPLGDSITCGSGSSGSGYRGPLHDLLSPHAANFQFIGTSTALPGSLPANQRYHAGHPSYPIQVTSNNLDGFDNTTYLQHGGTERNPNGGFWLTGGNGTGRGPMFPDIITLMTGTNDVLNLDGVEGRLLGLLGKIHTLRPTTKIFLAMITPLPDYSGDEVYNTLVRKVAADLQAEGRVVYLVDLNSGFPANGLTSDRVHPNDVGYQWMAERWFDAIVAAYSPATVNRAYRSPPPLLPGTIQAEDYDEGGAGVAYLDLTPDNEGGKHRDGEAVDIENTSDVDGNFQVFQTQAGEWLKYTVKVDSTGGFVPTLRVASPVAGAVVRLEVDGVDATGNIPLPATGGIANWQTVTLPQITMTAGEHVLRLVIVAAPNGSAGAINWLSFTTIPRVGPTAKAGPDISTTDQDGNGSEPVTLNASATVAGDSPNLTYTWTRNGATLATGPNPTLGLATGTYLIQLKVTDGNALESTDTVVVTVFAKGFVNGSFESGFNGWTVGGSLFIESASPYVATDGVKLVGFNGGNATPNAVLSQSFGTAVGGTYTLAFDAGALNYNTSPQTMLVTVTGTGSLLSQTIVITGPGNGGNYWLPQSFTFVANSAVSTLTFRDQSSATVGVDMLLDNVRISGPPAVPLNTAPVASANSYTTNENTTLIVPASGVLANDTDAQGDPLVAVLVSGPSHGSVILNANGSFTYTPASGYFGTDSFTYHANDGFLDSNVGTVTLTINEVIPPPVAMSDFYATNESTPLMIAAAGVLANDLDPRSRPLTAVLDAGPSHGTVSLNSNGSFTYTPTSGYFGTDSFTYHARNGFLNSSTVTVSLTVNEVIPAPVAVADSYSTTEGGTLLIAAAGVLSNDSDPRSRPLTAVLDAGPAHGSLSLNSNGAFVYTPAAGYFGADSFTYRARNGFLNSNIATANLTVIEVIPPPVAVAD